MFNLKVLFGVCLVVLGGVFALNSLANAQQTWFSLRAEPDIMTGLGGYTVLLANNTNDSVVIIGDSSAILPFGVSAGLSSCSECSGTFLSKFGDTGTGNYEWDGEHDIEGILYLSDSATGNLESQIYTGDTFGNLVLQPATGVVGDFDFVDIRPKSSTYGALVRNYNNLGVWGTVCSQDAFVDYVAINRGFCSEGHLKVYNDGIVGFGDGLTRLENPGTGTAHTIRHCGTGDDWYCIYEESSGDDMNLALFTQDGDATDDVGVRLYLKGTYVSQINAEYFHIYTDSINNVYRIFSGKTGTGTIRPIHIETQGNLNQVVIATDGEVGFNTGLPGGQIGVVGDIFIDGSSDEEQFNVQGHSTQTNPLAVFENSGGTDKVHIENDGNIEILDDNACLKLGLASDSEICYDGTDMTINPKVVGSGDLKILGNLNVTDNFTGNHIYGEMHFHNDTTGNVTALTEDNWFNITAFGQEYKGTFLNGFSKPDDVSLIAHIPGRYKVDYSITYTGTANNKYHITVGRGGIIQLNTETHGRTGTGTDVLSSSGTGFIDLNVNDRITLMAMNEDSDADITVFSANLNLIRIGD